MGAFPFPPFPVFPSFTWTISMGSLCDTKHAWEFIFPFLSFSVAKDRLPSHSLPALQRLEPFYTMKIPSKYHGPLAILAFALVMAIVALIESIGGSL